MLEWSSLNVKQITTRNERPGRCTSGISRSPSLYKVNGNLPPAGPEMDIKSHRGFMKIKKIK